MSYASRAGRAQTSSTSPTAFAVCQRCGIWTNRNRLRAQMEWRGVALQNIRLYVCDRCYDRPQEQFQALRLPPDPTPVRLPFAEPYLTDETGNTPPYGEPVGLDINAIAPLGINASGDVQAYGVAVPVLSVASAGGTTISVTTSKAHGLATDAQIAVEGLSTALACGFYSIVVTGGTTFTYTTLSAVPAGSLWQTASRMVTANVGLPLGQTTLTPV